MKKLLSTLVALAGLSLSGQVLASGEGDCHFHGGALVKQETVTDCAVKRQRALIANGKIDKTWQAIKPASPEQVEGQRGKEWKVAFKDAAAADKSKETLYMFFTLQGNFIAANFTGK